MAPGSPSMLRTLRQPCRAPSSQRRWRRAFMPHVCTHFWMCGTTKGTKRVWFHCTCRISVLPFTHVQWTWFAHDADVPLEQPQECNVRVRSAAWCWSQQRSIIPSTTHDWCQQRCSAGGAGQGGGQRRHQRRVLDSRCVIPQPQPQRHKVTLHSSTPSSASRLRACCASWYRARRGEHPRCMASDHHRQSSSAADPGAVCRRLQPASGSGVSGQNRWLCHRHRCGSLHWRYSGSAGVQPTNRRELHRCHLHLHLPTLWNWEGSLCCW